MICEQCKRDFPKDAIQELESGTIDPRTGCISNQTFARMCAICALKQRNADNGLPPDTPFQGPKAKKSYEMAIRHLEKTGQHGP